MQIAVINTLPRIKAAPYTRLKGANYLLSNLAFHQSRTTTTISPPLNSSRQSRPHKNLKLKPPNWLPLQPRFNRRPIKMPPINTHNSVNKNPVLAHKLTINSGDWNAKHSWWGNVRSCRRGLTLLDTILASPSLNILATGGATHYPFNQRNRPSAIDFAIYSGFPHEALHSYSSLDLSSDHLPIHVQLSISSLSPSQANK